MEASAPRVTDEYLTPPPLLTGAGWRFYEEHVRLLHFVSYVANLAGDYDLRQKVIVDVLYKLQDDTPENKTAHDDALAAIKKSGATQALRQRHKALLLEMMLSRAADNFLVYISDLLALIFHGRPEMLKSSEVIRLDEVLKHETMADLLHELAERRVSKLSYQGMRDLTAYIADRLGLTLFHDTAQLERAVRIIEARNLIVHNRGVVNEVFLARVPTSSAELGGRLEFEPAEIFDDCAFLAQGVYDIDLRATEKFGLAGQGRPRSDVAP